MTATHEPRDLLAALLSGRGYEAPPPYEVDRTGVWMVRETDKGERVRNRIAFGPLAVIRVFTDPDGEQLVELAWMDGARAVTRTVPRAVAKSGRQLVKALGNAGIPIVEADARQVERYLAAIEADNREAIPRVELARQLGWQPDGQFVFGQDAPRHIEPAYEEQRSAISAYRCSGSLCDWQTAVKLLEPYPIPRFALAVGLAAPLLKVLRIDSFTVDISGRSTGGKTTSAMVALSPWACPTEQSGGIASWRTTMLAAEKRLHLSNGLPTVFDETQAAKTEALINDVLYQVPMNRGTSRGGGYPSDLPWHGILVSTGEQPALSFTTFEGASARILSPRGAPFGRDGDKSATAARAVSSAFAENFGTAGPEFVARLVEELAAEGGADKLRRRHGDLAAEHRGGSDVSNRRAVSIAVVRLAAELAYEWEIVPLPPLEAEEIDKMLSVEQARDDRGAMALDIAREYVSRSPNRMWTAAVAPDSTPPLGWIGAYLSVPQEDGTTRQTVALAVEALGEELGRRNYRIEAAKEAWTEDKLITLDTSGQLIRRRFNGGRARVFEFDRAMFDGDDEPEQR